MSTDEKVLPPPAIAEPSTDPQPQALARIDQQARIVGEALPAAILSAVAGKHVGSVVTPAAYTAYLNNFSVATGGTPHPVEAMLKEQLVWAHFSVGNLLAEAAIAKTPEATAALTAVAAKLMSEARKTGLVLLESAVLTAVNMADQQDVPNSKSDSKLGSNKRSEHSNDSGSRQPGVDSASNCRPVKQGKARKTHRRGSPAAA